MYVDHMIIIIEFEFGQKDAHDSINLASNPDQEYKFMYLGVKPFLKHSLWSKGITRQQHYGSDITLNTKVVEFVECYNP